jgi:hypothetical protein
MELPVLLKVAALRPDVQLQPHQQEVANAAAEQPVRKLLFHSLGSGKSLSGIGAAEAAGMPYTVIAPASLRPNYQKEIQKFTDRPGNNVLSYSQLARGDALPGPQSLIMDEAQAIRNPNTTQAQQAISAAAKAKQVLLLSGSPVVNRPGDFATAFQILTGKPMTPDEFESRYVSQRKTYPSVVHRLFGWSNGTEPALKNERELRRELSDRVHHFDRGKPVVPVENEDVHVAMSPDQANTHARIWGKLPWWVRFKLQNNATLSDAELRRTVAFITGPRQVGLSTLPFMRTKDPIKAFQGSTKLQEAHRRLTDELADSRKKALVFSNYIEAGLVPYSAGLAAAGIPHATFHGGLTDRARKKLVEDFNDGKIRVAPLGPSGTEGLSFKGTQLVQLLDPHWHPARQQQSVGRALRYDSHADLPEELRHVKVQRFFSRLPYNLSDQLLSRVGFDRTDKVHASDDHLRDIAETKNKKNKLILDVLRDIGSK